MRRAALAMVIALATLSGGSPARASGFDPDGADSVVLRARREGLDEFCAKPSTPLSPRARAMCPMAPQIPQCEAFVAACDEKPLDLDKLPKWNLAWLAQILAAVAHGIVWILLALVVGLIAAFVISALRRARKDTRLADKPEPKATITPDPMAEALLETSDAEAFLQRANEHAQRGELDRAALLYLAAALRALDRRGAIRIAKHRTNGEYVRACKEHEATTHLRAIVRAVDRVQFGREPPTRDGVTDIASRAAWIVRAVVATTLAIVLAGCTIPDRGPVARAGDPGGDDLFMALLERQGADVKRLGGSLSSLPMPDEAHPSPLVIVDVARTPLEDETRAHLLRWVKGGGRLLLAGDAKAWPEEIGAKPKDPSTTRVKFVFPDVDEDDEDEKTVDAKARTYAAHVAEARGIEWGDAYVLATTEDHVTYAAVEAIETGVVVGLAGDDLLTNAGIAVTPNAKAVVALIERYARGRKIRVAQPQDGISPPSNPLAALLRAGLGLALAHGAIATALLMLAFGVRQARARPTPLPSRRAWTEHIAATGTLYARARLAPHALFAYARFVDGRLRARMPRGMSDPAAFLALRSRADAARCSEVWALATSARSADRPRGDELVTLRDLRALYAAAMKTE